MVVISAIGALVLCWGLGAGVKKMLKYQPMSASLAEFSRETSVTPGAICDENANLDAIRVGTSGCILGRAEFASTPRFVILGDSHARMWAVGLDVLGTEFQHSVKMMAYSSCTPLVNYVPSTRRECVAIMRDAMDYVINSPIQQVVLAGYWVNAMEDMGGDESRELFKTRLEETVKILQEAGKHVVIMHDIPEMDSDQILREKFIQSLRQDGAMIASMTLMQHWERQFSVRKMIFSLQELYGIDAVNPDAYICPNSLCIGAEGGRTLYRDRHHLTDAASIKFRKVFDPLFD